LFAALPRCDTSAGPGLTAGLVHAWSARPRARQPGRLQYRQQVIAIWITEIHEKPVTALLYKLRSYIRFFALLVCPHSKDVCRMTVILIPNFDF